jgi:alkylhydroperoxidase/carboxymuconolactone decarboxylase family protein YurZ/DNA-binding transcriptional regulator YhcF (GntR family)
MEYKRRSDNVLRNLTFSSLQNANIPPDLVGSMALVQMAIAASLSTPEKMSSGLAAMMKRSDANPESLEKPLRELLAKNGVTAEALEKAVLVQKAALACGLVPRDLSAVLALQAALSESGWSPKEISLAFAELAAKTGADMKQLAHAMTTAMDQARLKDDEVLVGCDLFKAAEQAAKAGQFDGVAFIKGQKKGGNLCVLLQKALDMSKVDGNGLAKALLVLKVMESSECPPGELAKICRIENALIGSGAPAGVVSKTIAAVIEPRNKNLLEKVKKPLLDIQNGAALELSAETVSFGSKLTSAMTTNDHSAEEIKAVLDSAMMIAGLTDEDVAKAMLVQKAMSATGVTPEVMAQVVMLQKALAASGASPEEIAAILASAVGQGLSDKEISDIMSRVMGNSDLSKEDVENMMQLQKSLKTGAFRKAGVTPEVMEQLVTLQKALEASGASPEEIAKALAQATSSDMSDEAVAELMEKALSNNNIDREDFKNVSELQKNLKSGGLKAMGVTPEIMDQMVTLQKILEASGKSKEDISEIIARATSAGLSEQEISQVISKALENANLSHAEVAKIKALEESLKGGKLKSGGMKADVLSQVSLLQRSLLNAGVSENEIAEILAKATCNGLSQEEIAKVMSKIMSNPNLSPEERDKMAKLQNDLAVGNLRTAGMTKDKMDKLMTLRKALEVNGASDEEIEAVLAKATAGNLSEKEIDGIVSKALTSKDLSKSEKEKLKGIKADLKSGGLKVGGVTAGAVQQMMLLQETLRKSGASDEEIADILNKASSGQLSDAAVDDLMTKVLAQKNIARDEFDGMVKLQDSLKGGKLKTPGTSAEVMEQILLLQKALEATGASTEEIANFIAKATGPGLSDEAISDLMSKVLNNKNLTPQEREKMMRLQKNLKDGNLKMGNKMGDSIEELLASGQFDRSMLAKALLVQKILADSGLDPDDMGKAVLLQKALMEAGASPEKIAQALKSSMIKSGMSLEHMMTMMAIGLKSRYF